MSNFEIKERRKRSVFATGSVLGSVLPDSLVKRHLYGKYIVSVMKAGDSFTLFAYADNQLRSFLFASYDDMERFKREYLLADKGTFVLKDVTVPVAEAKIVKPKEVKANKVTKPVKPVQEKTVLSKPVKRVKSLQDVAAIIDTPETVATGVQIEPSRHFVKLLDALAYIPSKRLKLRYSATIGGAVIRYCKNTGNHYGFLPNGNVLFLWHKGSSKPVQCLYTAENFSRYADCPVYIERRDNPNDLFVQVRSLQGSGRKGVNK